MSIISITLELYGNFNKSIMTNISFSNCGGDEIGEFYILEFEIDIALRSFGKLVEESEKTIFEFEKAVKKKFGYDEQNGFECLAEEIDMVDKFRDIQRNAIFLMAYSYYEGTLKSIASMVESKLDNNILINDLSGSNSKLYWNYLTKILQINTDGSLGKIFVVFEKLFKLRNKVTHELNQISENLIQEFKQYGIKFKNGVFEISDIKFFDYLFKQMQAFFDLLLIAIDESLKALRLNEVN